MVTTDRYGVCIGRMCSTAARLRRTAAPSVPAAAAKGMHQSFGMTGTNADAWPLSPKDWSTG
jgi:hypothetical protein